MWPFRRRRRTAPTGSLRLGELSDNPADYTVYTVSESRFPETFTSLWASATEEEREDGQARRWARLVPLYDPAFGAADVAVELEGQTACYLRPPHLGKVAALAQANTVEAIEVPALIVQGPAGPTVTLLIAYPD